MKGYFSLVQYCPDESRAEVANVGVVLLCPELHYVGCKMSSGNDGPRRFFRLAGEQIDWLNELKDSVEQRIRIDRKVLWRLEAFEHYIATRANGIYLTAPRYERLEDPEADLQRLFKELVGGRSRGEAIERGPRGVSVRPALREMFARPELEPKIARNMEVEPKLGRPFKADYAYFNGIASFVIPQVIHGDEVQTMREVESLASRGRTLKKHGYDGGKAQLVVPLPDPRAELASQTKEAQQYLQDFEVRTVWESDLEEIADEIREKAHLISSLRR